MARSETVGPGLALFVNMTSKQITHRRVASDTARLETDGMVAGLIAGAFMFFVSMVLAAFTGGGFLTPFRYAGSIIMHDNALMATPLLTMVAGAIVHAAASVLFGFLFGLVASGKQVFVHDQYRGHPLLAALIGAFVGLLLWLVNIELVARFFYPWFAAYALPMLLLHVFAFGAPLGLAYLWLRRRRAELGQEPSGYPNQAPLTQQPAEQ
jgi:hypothetical protein